NVRSRITKEDRHSALESTFGLCTQCIVGKSAAEE
ncbi:hypothetical protein A2U01_0051177, partial [Trifolium medium]|nr:hypothetical protein [Trifolium medium]